MKINPEHVVDKGALGRLCASAEFYHAARKLVAIMHVLTTHASQFVSLYLRLAYASGAPSADLAVTKETYLEAMAMLRRVFKTVKPTSPRARWRRLLGPYLRRYLATLPGNVDPDDPGWTIVPAPLFLRDITVNGSINVSMEYAAGQMATNARTNVTTNYQQYVNRFVNTAFRTRHQKALSDLRESLGTARRLGTALSGDPLTPKDIDTRVNELKTRIW
jgi:hypothetical protein